MNCNYCMCQECKYYEDCEPCRGDYNYEHPCTGDCEDFEPQEISDRNLKMWEDIYAEEKRRERSE